ncbi:hypothetical protein [Streptomyces sp. cmx-10-25]
MGPLTEVPPLPTEPVRGTARVLRQVVRENEGPRRPITELEAGQES